MPPKCCAAIFLSAACLVGTARGQLEDRGDTDAVRVTVAQNQDGSRTTYQYDMANRKAVATTNGRDGKLLGKIHYELDEAGRFLAGEVYDAKDQLRFKTKYKYGANNRLEEETQLSKENAIQHKIVYSYDAAGKQTGFAVYDSAGKLVSQTRPDSSRVSKKEKRK